MPMAVPFSNTLLAVLMSEKAVFHRLSARQLVALSSPLFDMSMGLSFSLPPCPKVYSSVPVSLAISQ